MNYRLNPVGIAVVVILLLLAAGLFAYTLLSDRNGTPEEGVQNPENTAEENVPHEVLTAKHDFEDGVHTVAGELNVPTPCHVLDAEAFFIDGNPENVEIRLNATLAEEEGQEGEVCAQVMTPARYKVSFEAPENARIAGALNGAPIQLNLVDVPEGEDLDDFDIFIKG